jgi:ABC-type transporter Mla subunit MlaD
MIDPALFKTFVDTQTQILKAIVPILVNLEPALKTLLDQQSSATARLTALEGLLQTAETAASPTNAALPDAIAELNKLIPQIVSRPTNPPAA